VQGLHLCSCCTNAHEAETLTPWTRARPGPNLNDVTFPPVNTTQIRVVMTGATGFTVGLKEIEVFE
jgi:hypothetical protein